MSKTVNSILIAAIHAHGLAIPDNLASVIRAATTDTSTHKDRLRIILVSPLFALNAISRTACWREVQEILTFAYVEATRAAQELNNILLDVDVLVYPSCSAIPRNLAEGFHLFHTSGLEQAELATLNPSFTSLRSIGHGSRVPVGQSSSLPTSSLPSTYPVVALGGTFDHLHAGHKILLSMGSWIASEKLIVGTTDDALLINKAHKSVLEPLEKRISRVRSFLTLFRPDITHDVVPISDVYGPTGWDTNIQALVVSKETLSGAVSIAAHRESKSLPPLQSFVIDVISSTESSLADEDPDTLKTAKMSSTFIRAWILENGVKDKT